MKHPRFWWLDPIFWLWAMSYRLYPSQWYYITQVSGAMNIGPYKLLYAMWMTDK